MQVWNRDVIAARNMLRCVLAAAQGDERPEALRRIGAIPADLVLAEVQAEVQDLLAEGAVPQGQ